jgi:hypothetical protein
VIGRIALERAISRNSNGLAGVDWQSNLTAIFPAIGRNARRAQAPHCDRQPS